MTTITSVLTTIADLVVLSNAETSDVSGSSRYIFSHSAATIHKIKSPKGGGATVCMLAREI